MRLSPSLACLLALSCAAYVVGDEDPAADAAPDVIQLNDGKITLPAPPTWKRVQPRNRIIEHEFATKPAEGDTKAGRVTLMGAGGGVEANISRWKGQFRPNEGEDAPKTKVEKLEVDGQTIHLVSINGTYIDRPGGPFAGGRAIPRPNYRMLGAIIVTENAGHYFVKLLGPVKTVDANEKPLREMLKQVKVGS